MKIFLFLCKFSFFHFSIIIRNNPPLLSSRQQGGIALGFCEYLSASRPFIVPVRQIQSKLCFALTYSRYLAINVHIYGSRLGNASLRLVCLAHPATSMRHEVSCLLRNEPVKMLPHLHCSRLLRIFAQIFGNLWKRSYLPATARPDDFISGIMWDR